MSLEAEYNNMARIPGSGEIVARWSRDAAAFRAAWPRSELDLPYGGRERERFDLFLPEAPGPAPLALFIHGGYWQKLDRKAVSHFAHGLLRRGVAVAVPSYDLCPEVTLAAIAGQMGSLAAQLFTRFGRPMLAAGHSAGGHLSAMLLRQDLGRFAPGIGRRAVPAALPISGVFELEPLRGTSLGTALRLSAEEARALSPRWMAPPADALLHAVAGAEESAEFLRQTREFAEAWGGSREALPGRHHLSVLDPLTDPDHPLTARAAAMAGRLASA